MPSSYLFIFSIYISKKKKKKRGCVVTDYLCQFIFNNSMPNITYFFV